MVSHVTSYFFAKKTEEPKPRSDSAVEETESSMAIIPYTPPQVGKEELAIVAAPSSLVGRAKPIQTKEILKVLVDQVKQNPKHAAELSESLKAAMEDHPESRSEFQEVMELLAADKTTTENRIDRIDSIEKEWLDDCVFVENKLEVIQPPPGYEKTWLSYAVATGGAVWYVTKVSGTVLYFVCDKVILNGTVLKLAAAAGSVVSLANMVGSPCLPVLQTVVVFLFKKLIL